MRFPTMWYVQPAKPQISLRIRAVWSEPLLVVWVFYDCLATDWTPIGASKLKRRLQRLVRVYTCQKCHIVGNLMHWLIWCTHHSSSSRKEREKVDTFCCYVTAKSGNGCMHESIDPSLSPPFVLGRYFLIILIFELSVLMFVCSLFEGIFEF